MSEAPLPEPPERFQKGESACGKAIDLDPNFVSLSAALHYLGLLERYATFRGLRRDSLESLLARCYDRACFALPGASSAPDEEHKGVVDALVSVADVLQRSEAGRYDRSLFAEAARTAADESTVPFLRGAFLGLLCEIRELPAETLAAEVRSLAGASQEQMIAAGDLLERYIGPVQASLAMKKARLLSATPSAKPANISWRETKWNVS